MSIRNIARNLNIIKDVVKVSICETKTTLVRNSAYRIRYWKARMLITAHSLEKGMGIPNTRRGYGQKNAIKLCEAIEKYLDIEPDSIEFALIESFGILKNYIEYQEKDNISIDLIKNKFVLIESRLRDNQKSLLNKYSYGMYWIEKDKLLSGTQMDFEKFVTSRHSARLFDERIVNQQDIMEAIRLANFAPSACNRQPVKVYCALGNRNAQVINEYLAGNKAFTDQVCNFAIITSDRAYFAGDEQYQWYVNGGIYLAYFVEALHSLGIGSCIMQWFAFSKNEKKLKKILGISSSEAIIAVVCLGYYPERMKCICAQRKSSSETVIFFDSKDVIN